MHSERVLEQRRKAQKRYRERHPERNRDIQRRYQQANRDRVNGWHRAAYKRDPIKAAAYKRNQMYGITQEWFDAKFIEQEGKCAICLRPLLKPQLDHDHVSEKPRGLICRFCNLVLGNAHDSVLVLENSILYLRKYGADDGRAGSSGVIDS